ncbi:MAG: glycerophosphodiester phosphodiesterase family protein [Syntrophales bacterium]|nr:glycerophosphodiester phosphodiesterase family protein [Syntrophales bacterium]
METLIGRTITLMTATLFAQNTLDPAMEILSSPRPLVIGHRGCGAVAPENTIPSFKLALTAGADLVELDYHHTKDGVPVVIHDFTLDRTTDAKRLWGGSGLNVADRTAEELCSLDAGGWFASRYAGARLPTLVEALEVIQAQGMALIERKGGQPATILRLIHEKGWVNRLIVQSFDWEYLSAFHELEPRQVLGALGPPRMLADGRNATKFAGTLSGRWIDELEKTGARIAVWNKAVSRKSVRLSHERGFKVWVYTVNDSALAIRLLDRGVDGIITDNAALMFRTLAQRNHGRSEGAGSRIL